jgi:hypothetical protein
MALIVEDGSIVANANSYVSDADYTAYAAARGKTIGASAAIRDQELILAMDYIESHRAQFQGSKVSSAQALQWPRTGAYIDGFAIGSDEIPQELKSAQIEAAILANSTALLPSGNTQNVQSEKLGELQISYFQNGSWETLRTDSIDVYLDVLLDGDSGIYTFRVDRA